MKKLSSLIISLLMCFPVLAQHVTEAEALKKAQAFMQGKMVNNARGRNGAPAKPRAMKRVAQATQSDALYIFNVEDNGGFVIVSGDERTEAILGYSTEGHIDPQTMPENMRAWLKGYEEQIKAIPANALPAKLPSISDTPIEPLLNSQWGQKWPYNLQCPTAIPEGETESQHCVTGCVATSMAQIMNYWHYPLATTAAIPSWRGLSEVPAGTVIDWANMADIYEYSADSKGNREYDWQNGWVEVSTTPEQRNAVALLMKLCGMAVKMNYGLKESSAYSQDAVEAFRNYFGYKNEMRMVSQMSYSYANWQRLIYSELAQKRPVMYDGYSDPFSVFYGGSGHSFVVDGYDKDGYFHFNFGWDGFESGYYLLFAHDFNYIKNRTCQYAIVGIQPEAGGAVADIETIATYTSNVNVLKLTNVETDGPLYHNQVGGNITLTLYNSSNLDFSGFLYPIIFDEFGIKIVCRGFWAYVPAGSSEQIVIPREYLSPLISYGIYKIRLCENHLWSSSDPNFIDGEATVSVILEPKTEPEIKPEPDSLFTFDYWVEGIDEEGWILHGQTCKLHFRITCLGKENTTYGASVYLNLTDNTGKFKDIILPEGGVHLERGQSAELEYDIIDERPDWDIYAVNVKVSEFYTRSDFSIRAYFCHEKPTIATEPVEVEIKANPDYPYGVDYDFLPPGYYVLSQNGFNPFPGYGHEGSLIDYEADVARAWRDYQVGIVDIDVTNHYFDVFSVTNCFWETASARFSYIFDYPSHTPYTNSISVPLDGKNVFFPADVASMKEALSLGLYKNKVACFHPGGSLHIQGMFRQSYDGLTIEEPHLYYFPIIKSATIKGDVNGDGAVDVADIATVIDVMAKGTNDKVADVNSDGAIDVADIATIIDIMAANARRQMELEE